MDIELDREWSHHTPDEAAIPFSITAAAVEICQTR